MSTADGSHSIAFEVFGQRWNRSTTASISELKFEVGQLENCQTQLDSQAQTYMSCTHIDEFVTHAERSIHNFPYGHDVILFDGHH